MGLMRKIVDAFTGKRAASTKTTDPLTRRVILTGPEHHAAPMGRTAAAIKGVITATHAATQAVKDFTDEYRKIRTKQKKDDAPFGQGRRLRGLREINEALVRPFKAALRRGQTVDRPEPTNLAVRMKDGRVMIYYTDGSLRHRRIQGLSTRISRSVQRRAAVKNRRANRKALTAQAPLRGARFAA